MYKALRGGGFLCFSARSKIGLGVLAMTKQGKETRREGWGTYIGRGDLLTGKSRGTRDLVLVRSGRVLLDTRTRRRKGEGDADGYVPLVSDTRGGVGLSVRRGKRRKEARGAGWASRPRKKERGRFFLFFCFFFLFYSKRQLKLISKSF